MKRLPIILAVTGAGVVGALAWALGSEGSQTWPSKQALLTAPPLLFDQQARVKRVYLDPGHGADGNIGNVGAHGRAEQEFTLSLALDVAAVLEASGRFTVRLSRQSGELVPYPERVEEANAWPADLFVSLHSDVRRPEGVGYSVLWSDDGPPELAAERVALARRVAQRLALLPLPAYRGEEYAGLYEGDDVPGVFVDRHEPDKRIFVLNRPVMPSIIIETHNAKSLAEAERWDEPAVRKAFAHALALALAAP